MLGNIIDACDLSNDPEELFSELKETLHGGIANLPECVKNLIIKDRLDFLNSNGLGITKEQLISIVGKENALSCNVYNNLISEIGKDNNPPTKIVNQFCKTFMIKKL